MSNSGIINKIDRIALYTEVLKQVFDVIRKNIVKKNPHYNDIIEFIKAFNGSMALQKEQLNDIINDKSIGMIYNSLEIENYKITEAVVSKFKVAIQKNIISSNNEVSIESKGNVVECLKHKHLIDNVIEIITRHDYIKEDQLVLDIAELIEMIYTSPAFTLTTASFERMHKWLIKIYTKTPDDGIREQLKGIFHTIFITAFDRMSVYHLKKNQSQLDNYLIKEGKRIVDIICISYAYNGLIGQVHNPVPSKENDFFLPQYRIVSNIKLLDDNRIESGRFGWCFICRRGAEYYCKETKKPLCSVKCRDVLVEEMDKLTNINIGECIYLDTIYNLLTANCVGLLKVFCELLTKDTEQTKIKLFSINLLTNFLEENGKELQNRQEFINLAQADITEGILKNCVSEDVQLFQSSINVFFLLWKFYREYLKLQISMFNETIFLKILESENSSYTQKKIVLENFSNQSFAYFIELYANYDCDINEKFLLNRIITALSKIAKGKYLKEENTFTNKENAELRQLALKTLTELILNMSTLTLELYPNKQHFLKENPMETIGTPNEDVISDDYSTVDNYQNIIQPKGKIDLNLQRKYDYQTAKDKFNVKIKSGLNYLKCHDYISNESKEKEAKDIMSFLRTMPGLKKEHIGELLGEKSEIALLVLKYYAENFDFKGIHIVQALRTFLGTFQLPGEGQKIDRILEQFALKYHNDNQNMFSTADCAYYLSFTIILLQTELHNPNVKHKMSFDSFAQLLDGKNGETNLDKEYLNDIYNQIKDNPISLPEIEEQKDKLENKKENKYKRETLRILNECNEQLKQNKESKSYKKINDKESYLIPFMDSIHTPLLALFSVIIKECDEVSLYIPSIMGTSNLIKVLGILNMEYQKTAVVTFLCRITNLFQMKLMNKKNILCITEILQLAHSDCRYFKSTWNLILELTNKIYYSQLAINGSKAEKEIINQKLQIQKKANKEDEIEIEKENMTLIAKEINPDSIEKIFSNTKDFDPVSIVDFINSLCELGKNLFKNNDITKLFILQKIVEVVEINLFRMRFFWNTIWKKVSGFLIEIGLSENVENSLKAVDSLRQLAAKYLQKTESSDYHFQTEFLNPFLVIWEQTRHSQTKEYINSCISNLVLSEGKTIKSGWTVIFKIFSLLSDDLTSEMSKRTLQTLIDISRSSYILSKEMFPDFIKCLSQFSLINPEKVISLFNEYNKKDLVGNSLMTLIQSYSVLIPEINPNQRSAALMNFSDLTNRFIADAKFKLNSHHYWSILIEQILIPLIKKTIEKEDNEYLTQLLNITAGMFNDANFNDNNELLNSFLECLIDIVTISTNNLDISHNGIESIKYLTSLPTMKNAQFLHSFVKTIFALFSKCLQQDFFNLKISNFSNPTYYLTAKAHIDRILFDCIVHHNLLEITEQLISDYITSLSESDVNLIINCLDSSLTFSYNFNFNIELRIKVSQNFMENMTQIAALFKQQQKATKLYFNLLMKIYDLDPSNEPKRKKCVRLIMESAIKILTWFNEKSITQDKDQETNADNEDDVIFDETERLLSNMAESIFTCIFPSIMQLKFYTISEYKDSIVKILLEMIMCSFGEIRGYVKDILIIIYLQK